MHVIKIKVNGKPVSASVEARTTLVTFLRQNAALTGTHVGCDTAHCGACTVHVNGVVMKSCTILAVQADGTEVLTVEGLSADGLSPLQAQFKEHHGLQCGFCTPGMLMSAKALLAQVPNPTDTQIREWLDGNLCRCTGYENIIRAVRAASKAGN